MHVSIVVEGKSDEPVARRLSTDAGLEVHAVYVKGGKSQLDADLPRYAAAARQFPYFVLRGLDHDAARAPEWLRDRPTGAWLCVRLPVRHTEAWLLADRERFCEFFGVRPGHVREPTEAVREPERYLVDLVRHSTSAAVRRAMVPATNSHVSVGPAYEAMLIEFATRCWRPAAAAQRSDSLRRARAALSNLSARWRARLG